MNLEEFSLQMQAIIEGEGDQDKLVEAVRKLVSRLCTTTDWLGESLEKLLFDREFLNSQTNSIWPGEFSLTSGPNGKFNALAYVWEPDSADTIHDHGSWGVVGTVLNRIIEQKYRRLDDGSREGHAELSESARLVIDPGETTFVLPLDEGIHRLENPGKELAVSINVYGKGAPRGYVRFFDAQRQTVRRVLPPRNLKRLTAMRILGVVGEPWAGDILKNAQQLSLPDPIREECERALARLHGNDPVR